MLAAAFLLGSTPVFAREADAAMHTDAMLQAKLNRQLRQGMSGEDVATLQALLAAQPDVYPEGLVSGYFGSLTAKAVRKYQEKFGLSAVGQVGPLTRQKLNEFLSFNVAATTTATTTLGGICLHIPPGHLVAPGWMKKHGGTTTPEALPCQILPPGILKVLGRPSTTTPPMMSDHTAPVISAVSATTTTATTTQIGWVTNELSTTKLIYGTTTPVLFSSATTTPSIVSGLSLNHSVNLSGLTASTTYYFVVESADSAGNAATSSQMSFTTLGL